MALLSGLRLERALASPRYRDGTFHNTHSISAGIHGNPLPVLGEFFFGGKKRVPRSPLPLEDPRDAWRHPNDSNLRLTWLGHSTLVIELGQTRLLTDPVFGERASPVSFAGPKRFHPPPVRLDQLPALDAILLSHDHYDHLCISTLRELARLGVPIVTSLGVGARLEALGFAAELVHELDWWESITLGELTFTATPAQHFSGRGMTDRNATSWSSWVIESAAGRLFFSGDTGLTDEFSTIAERFGGFDLTMLEIGAFDPAWADIHLGARNAHRAFELLGGGTLLPVHWGTFDLALHPWDQPAEELVALCEAAGTRLITPRLGRLCVPSRIETVDPWWRETSAQPKIG
ncbi:MAG TPA: MBL fold metallo-hydrolase [Polyangiaceae bacterium]|nr:MBL fold metallo-hydrolase [Polyangiaceae bacterium]